MLLLCFLACLEESYALSGKAAAATVSEQECDRAMPGGIKLSV